MNEAIRCCGYSSACLAVCNIAYDTQLMVTTKPYTQSESFAYRKLFHLQINNHKGLESNLTNVHTQLAIEWPPYERSPSFLVLNGKRSNKKVIGLLKNSSCAQQIFYPIWIRKWFTDDSSYGALFIGISFIQFCRVVFFAYTGRKRK